jgi:hypothetical protein
MDYRIRAPLRIYKKGPKCFGQFLKPMNVNITIDLESIPDAARRAKTTVQAVRNRIEAKNLQTVRANGKCILLRREDVDQWIAERKANFR